MKMFKEINWEILPSPTHNKCNLNKPVAVEAASVNKFKY